MDTTDQVGVKADAGKDRWDLLPFDELRDVVRVLTMGAMKYSEENWKHVPGGRRRYLAAALRHISARACGQMRDAETGLPHLAHAVCCLLFWAWFDNNDKAE